LEERKEINWFKGEWRGKEDGKTTETRKGRYRSFSGVTVIMLMTSSLHSGFRDSQHHTIMPHGLIEAIQMLPYKLNMAFVSFDLRVQRPVQSCPNALCSISRSGKAK